MKMHVRLAEYLKAHPIEARQGVATVDKPNDLGRAPAPEFLIRCDELWYVRWPDGRCKWEADASMRERGFVLPATPILGDIQEVGA